MRWLPFLIPLVLVGCALPQPPPPMSMAKFARTETEQDRLGFSTGLGMYIDEEEDPQVFAFPVEAGMGVSLGERYDLGFSVGNLLGTAEGNFAVIDSTWRLGLIHGLGLGLLTTQEEQALLTQFTGGAFVQTGRKRAFFMGIKATRGTVVGGESFRPTTFLTGTLGFMPEGRLKVIPEIAVQRSNWRAFDTMTDGPADEVSQAYTIVIGVSVLHHYFRKDQAEKLEPTPAMVPDPAAAPSESL